MFSKRRFVMLAVAIGIISAVIGSALSARGLDARALRAEKVTKHSVYGTAETVSGRFVVEAPGTRLDKALGFIAGRAEDFRIAAPERELQLLFERTDELGLTHLRFQQVYEGLRVWGCQTIVHFEDDRTIYLAGGQTIPTPSVSTVPAISETEAVSGALTGLADQQLPADLKTESELLIYPDAGAARLAWLVTVTSPTNGAVRWLVFVDAQSGTLLLKYNDIHFDGSDIGSGPDVLNVNRTFPIYQLAGAYKMINTTHTGYITTYENYYGGGPISTDPDGDKVWDDDEDQKAAVSGHYNADVVYDYFLNTHGHDGYDGLGHDLLVNVHVGISMNNAFFDGETISFGDGDGINYLPLSGGLDVVAHEFTHAVTRYTADLIYAFQSGALNEHFSDAFGALIDRDDWQIGEDIKLAWPGYVRDLSNPAEKGHPACMSDYLTLDISVDGGGVHYNCGIPNHCLYWFVELGAGREVAEQIWYRCLSTYLTPSSGFYFWAGMIFQSCRDLYGTLYDATLEEALAKVELTTAYTGPEFIDVGFLIGGEFSDTVWVYNPGAGSVDASAVAPSMLGMTLTELAGNHPTIPAGDSAAFLVTVDGSCFSECEIGMMHDTLRFDVDGYIEAQVKLPVLFTIGYSTPSPQSESFSTTCMTATCTNQAGLLDMGRLGQDVLIDGSLLVGLMDGSTPTVYRSFYDVDKFLAADAFHSDDGLRSFRLASEDGRVLGLVEYSWDDTDPENCGFVIAEYTLRNPCDTPLTILTGLICDFDIVDGDANHVRVQETDQLIYMTDEADSYAVGMALLSGEARNLRPIYNPYLVDYGFFTDAVAYYQLSLTTSSSSPVPYDYSALLTFGEGLIGPEDSVTYRVALLASPSGSEGLGSVLEKAQAWAWTCCEGIRGNANNDPDDKVNISDVAYLLDFLFAIPTGPEPTCWEEGNANGDVDEKVNVSDASYLLTYLFGIPTGPEPKPCP